MIRSIIIVPGVAILLMGGCLPATQTVVTLDVEAKDGLENSPFLTVSVIDDGGAEVFNDGLDPRGRWPIQIPIVPRFGDADRRFTFSATLQTDAGRFVEVETALGFAEKDRFDVSLRFEAACLDSSCLEGYTCVGGDCVSSFMEARDCGIGSDRGCDPQNNCGCPENYECLDLQGGATCRATACSGSSQCAGDEVCSFASRRCVPQTGMSCESLAEPGPAEPGQTCSDAIGCQVGYTCVGSFAPDGESSFAYSESGGWCRRSCNPCESSSTCAPPDDCAALPGGGGFCSRGGLAPLNETCSSDRLCAGGLACLNDICRTACRGPFEGAAASRCSVRSDLCPNGEACAGVTGREAGSCEATGGRFPTPEGGLCAGAGSCACPLSCLVVSGSSFSVCGAPLRLTCDDCPGGPLCPCPESLDCRVSHGDVVCAQRDPLACDDCSNLAACACPAGERCVTAEGSQYCASPAICSDCPEGPNCPCPDDQRCVPTVGGAACVQASALGTFDPCVSPDECKSGLCTGGACEAPR